MIAVWWLLISRGLASPQMCSGPAKAHSTDLESDPSAGAPKP